MNFLRPVLLFGLLLLAPACRRAEVSSEPNPFPVASTSYGKTSAEEKVETFTLRNTNGMVAEVMEYGATLRSLLIPNRDGKPEDVTLGFNSLANWEEKGGYYGATVGRYGNRIAGGTFSMDGKTYQLDTNNTPGGIPSHLHGGTHGFDDKVWKGETVQKDKARGVKFTRTSPDGEEGYPGKVVATVTYWLTDDNELIWEAEATTDSPTPLNLIHHSYWNLSGDPSTTVLDHELQIVAKKFLPTDAGLIPTGELASVEGTPMDFRTPTAVGARIDAPFEPLRLIGGYDHTFVLDGRPGVRLAARLRDPKSGRVMEIHTNQPGLQVYVSAGMADPTITKGGKINPPRGGICLESGAFPDSPNHPEFPSAVTVPGETYRHTLVHKFYAR